MTRFASSGVMVAGDVLAGGQIAHRDIQKITVKLGIKDAITTVAQPARGQAEAGPPGRRRKYFWQCA